MITLHSKGIAIYSNIVYSLLGKHKMCVYFDKKDKTPYLKQVKFSWIWRIVWCHEYYLCSMKAEKMMGQNQTLDWHREEICQNTASYDTSVPFQYVIWISTLSNFMYYP